MSNPGRARVEVYENTASTASILSSEPPASGSSLICDLPMGFLALGVPSWPQGCVMEASSAWKQPPTGALETYTLKSRVEPTTCGA